MDIKEAKERIEKVTSQSEGDDNTRLSLAIKALERSGADYSSVSPQLERLLLNESRLREDKEKWSEEVYVQALAMKRRWDCKDYLKENKGVIDGETQSMWAGIISAILGLVATAVMAVLTLLNVIEGVDIDKLAYIISLCGWAVTVVITVVSRIINKVRVKRHDESCAYTIAELTAVKYEDSNALVKALLPTYIKNSFNKNKVKGDMVVNGVRSAENSFNGNTTGGDFIVNGTKDN